MRRRVTFLKAAENLIKFIEMRIDELLGIFFFFFEAGRRSLRFRLLCRLGSALQQIEDFISFEWMFLVSHKLIVFIDFVDFNRQPPGTPRAGFLVKMSGTNRLAELALIFVN